MNIKDIVTDIGIKARDAASIMANATSDAKIDGLRIAANSLLTRTPEILSANNLDLENGKINGLSPAMLDRLQLTQSRIAIMAEGLDNIANLQDPVGHVIDQWERPNGLSIKRIRIPLGVIGIIYESRPNVTADAGALCLKSGNAAILRGGSESYNSSVAILSSLHEGTEKAGLPKDAIQMIPTTSREAVGEMLRLGEYIDVIVPRGGKSLVERVQLEAKVPVFAHLEGICHTYVNENSDPTMAREVVLNAKMRRTGICGATETLLIDKTAAESHLPSILNGLIEAGCEIRGDRATRLSDTRVTPASEKDWDTEYLDAIISVKQVSNVEEAIRFVNRHGSEHTDAIITNDAKTAEKFLNDVNSAIVLHNASTQFADGGEFGMGAEIGISTGKLHARGPVGIEQLTTFKYVVRGAGQTRV